MSASLDFPTVVTTYNAAAVGALQLNDTTSQFDLDGPPNSPTVFTSVIYTLPGFPFDALVTPGERLLEATLSSGGSAVICPPDYALNPRPTLADFRGIFLFSVGDFVRVFWNGQLWTIAEVGGPTVAVATLGQNLL